MNPTDFLYGCRSGLQKAVRRGDLDLGKTCFDALWRNKTHRAWLKWRMPVLVMEESYYLIGEFAKFLNLGDDSEKGWRRFFYELVISPKSKDATGLLRLVKCKAKISHREIELLQPWFPNENVDPALVVNVAASELNKKIRTGFTEYETEALNFLQKRTGMGGMLGDRQLCLICMGLIFLRGLDQKEVRMVIDDSVKAYAKNHGRPQSLNALPWFVFDMHTAVGKIVLSVLGKRKVSGWGITIDELRSIWFLLESGVVPKDQMEYSKSKNNPSPFESIWLVPFIQVRLEGIKRMKVKEVINFWKKEIRPEVMSLTEWLLKKRAEEKFDGWS